MSGSVVHHVAWWQYVLFHGILNVVSQKEFISQFSFSGLGLQINGGIPSKGKVHEMFLQIRFDVNR